MLVLQRLEAFRAVLSVFLIGRTYPAEFTYFAIDSDSPFRRLCFESALALATNAAFAVFPLVRTAIVL